MGKTARTRGKGNGKRKDKRNAERRFNRSGVNHNMLTRSGKKKTLRVAFIFKVRNLDENHINVTNFHKSLGVMNTTPKDFRNFKPTLQRYFESKNDEYETLRNTVAEKIVCIGKYKMLKFPEYKKKRLDEMTIDFLNFLDHHGYLTPGTEENLAPWVLNLKDENEKKLRKELHLKYGTANAPPLQSHHITLDYDNNENGDFDCQVSLELERIVVSETNMRGELVGPNLFSLVF
jgi:hypothetical protein